MLSSCILNVFKGFFFIFKSVKLLQANFVMSILYNIKIKYWQDVLGVNFLRCFNNIPISIQILKLVIF